MSQQEAIDKGNRARQLLEDPVFKEALENAELRFTHSWKHSTPEDTQGRENMYFALQALGTVAQELRIISDNGTVAAREEQQES